MEVVLKGPAVKEENSTSAADEDGVEVAKVSTVILSERSAMAIPSRSSPSNLKESITITQEEQLEYTKSEMGEVREENERLKMILAQLVRDYQCLQKQYFDTVGQEQSKKPLEATNPDDVEEPELVSLSLGTSSTGQKKEEIKTSKLESEKDGEGLTLGLDCKFEGFSKSPGDPVSNLSPDSSFEEEPGEPWPPSKILKNLRNGDHDEVSQQPQVKKARVSVRARCDAPTMNDGCQWRKYGQKIAKGNPCPRAYYRCTVAPGCPVRKQVQRCAEDMSILITTYEGIHNHPLPISATAMASTTAAAASMLMSGSSASGQGMAQAIGSLSSSSTAAASLSAANAGGLNFGLLRPRQAYLPLPSISSTPSYPTTTITLDLTAPPSTTSQLNQFSRFPRYSSTSFNFSPSESAAIPTTTSWSNGFLSYGSQASYNKSSSIGSLSLGRQPQDSFYQSILQKAISSSAAPAPNQHPLTDTIAKAITSDPSFQSAIAAAITSYVGGQTGSEGATHGAKLGEHFSSSVPHFAAAAAANGCASSYLNRSSSSSSGHQPNLLFLQPSLAFPSSKSTASADHNSESIN